MRKIIASMMVSVDGMFAGPNGELDWHHVDAEFNAYAEELLDHVDAILMGRVTYELMAAYWPSAGEDDPVIAARMNSLPKIVFSRTLDKAEWNNTRLIKEDIAEEVAELKRQPGKDLVLFGSATVLNTLMRLELIDEYRLIVNPVVLGQGKPLFQDVGARLELQLMKTRVLDSGNVILYYRPGKRTAA